LFPHAAVTSESDASVASNRAVAACLLVVLMG
jgi:hypothetical protein